MPNNTPAKRPSRRLKWLSAALLTLLLCSCGLKGDLTLEPDSPPSDTPASSEEDGNEDGAGFGSANA